MALNDSGVSKIRKTLQAFHKGESIPDSELTLTIKQLTTTLETFQNLDIKSMPEYDTFEKALRKDIRQLEEFQAARRR